MTELDEEWRPAVGFEGYYDVSNLGRVRTVERVVSNATGTRVVKSRIRACTDVRRGYKGVLLSKENKLTCARVHRLVARAFIPNPKNLETVDHINSDVTDNRAVNLRWASIQDNLRYMVEKGSSAIQRPRRAKRLTIEMVNLIRSSNLNTVELGRVLGINNTSVGRVRNNKTWREV